MSAKTNKAKKFYTVWEGIKTGVFDNWEACKQHILGYPKAKFKSFSTQHEAERAFKMGYEEFVKLDNKPFSIPKHIKRAICVDGACNTVSKDFEYQIIVIPSHTIIAKKGPFKNGSNNIAEFLGLVHALYWCKIHQSNMDIYSDSSVAMKWVKNREFKTTLKNNTQNDEVMRMLNNAVALLKKEDFTSKILKWDTKEWGENPADFGRKK